MCYYVRLDTEYILLYWILCLEVRPDERGRLGGPFSTGLPPILNDQIGMGPSPSPGLE